MALTRHAWGIREWLMMIFGVLYAAVTIMLTLRESDVPTTLEWWGLGPGVELAIWRIFTPPAPPSSGGEG